MRLWFCFLQKRAGHSLCLSLRQYYLDQVLRVSSWMLKISGRLATPGHMVVFCAQILERAILKTVQILSHFCAKIDRNF